MSVLLIFAIILAVLGVIGSVVPALPGPPLSWVALLFVYIAKGPAATTTAATTTAAATTAATAASAAPVVSTTALIIWALVVIAVTVLDYVVPAAMTKAAGGHKAASWGAVIGLFAGIFFTPVGMIAGSLLGAFLGELLIEERGVWDAFKASLGAFAGFIVGTFAKLAVSGILLWKVIAAMV